MSHDDRPIGRDTVRMTIERSAGEVAQADHAAAAGPAKRLGSRRGNAFSHDDRPIGRDAEGIAKERSAGEIAQADHAAAAGPTKRLEPRCGVALSHDDGPIGGNATGRAVTVPPGRSPRPKKFCGLRRREDSKLEDRQLFDSWFEKFAPEYLPVVTRETT